MYRTVIATLALLACAGVARAQDYKWTETRFNRVHLRNGNFIDGQLVESSDRDVTLRLSSSGDMKIRRDTIDRIELVKMRSLVELPRLASVATPVAKSKKSSGPPAPSIDSTLRKKLDKVLARLEELPPVAERDALTKELSKQVSAAPYLAVRLQDARDEVLPYLGRALWELKEPEMEPYLLAALDSERPAVLFQAILLCGRLDGGRPAASIRRFLTDRRPKLRSVAADALRQMGDESSLADILLLLNSEEAAVRSTAVNACLDLGRRAGKLELVASRLEEALERASGEAATDLVSALARAGQQRSAPALIRCLGDSNEQIRARAAAALAQIAPQEAVEAVAQRLTVEDSIPVLMQLVKASAALKSRDTVAPLIHLLRHRDEALLSASFFALKGITQQDFGTSYEAWHSWWEQVRAR